MFIYKKNILLSDSGPAKSTRDEEVLVFAFSYVKSI